MSARITRRTALRVVGAGLALPLGALALGTLRGAPQPVHWQGVVLGGMSAMTLWHPDPGVARRAIRRMLAEVDRLEDIFSLYRPDSQIARLNRDGALEAPAPALVEVIEASLRIASQSGGAFDPTIQPLWRLHAAGPPSDRALEQARALVGHGAVDLGARGIRLGREGMAISLNGIAQGHITDRVTEILGNEGFENAVIELGETRALGTGPDGHPFSIGLARPFPPVGIAHDLALADAALAVSGGYGTRLPGPGRHHIFDPRTGQSANRLAQVAVLSRRAMWADALSTAIYVAGEASARRLLDGYPDSRAILTRMDGSTVDI
ncbi:MAG: FAD:protein FMN transferase [Paracoccaceae bacterium]